MPRPNLYTAAVGDVAAVADFLTRGADVQLTKEKRLAARECDEPH